MLVRQRKRNNRTLRIARAPTPPEFIRSTLKITRWKVVEAPAQFLFNFIICLDNASLLVFIVHDPDMYSPSESTYKINFRIATRESTEDSAFPPRHE